MEDCPFCWERRVRTISGAEEKFPGHAGRKLMLCETCETWFWSDNGQPVEELCRACITPRIAPALCLIDVRRALASRGGWPKRRTAELNFLCSDCPHRRFGADGRPIAAPREYALYA